MAAAVAVGCGARSAPLDLLRTDDAGPAKPDGGSASLPSDPLDADVVDAKDRDGPSAEGSSRDAPADPPPCPDDDDDGVCNAADVCPVGDDAIDEDDSGFADACENLLASVAGGSSGWRAAGGPDVAIVLTYPEDPLFLPDNGSCGGVQLGTGLAFGDGDSGPFALTHDNDAGFLDLAACVTNGIDNEITSGWQTPGGAGGADVGLESTMLRERPTSTPDLAGWTIFYALLRLEEARIHEEQGGWRYDLDWTWELYGYRQ